MGWKAFVEGGVASIVAGCTTHPLDLIKVRMQLQGEGGGGGGMMGPHKTVPPPLRMGPLGMGAQILRTQGINALFAGVSATLLRQATYSTTRMGLYDIMKSKWERRDGGEGLGLHKKVVVGLVAGGIGAAVGNPADMAMVRMQADGRLEASRRRNYSSVGDAVVRTAREEGMGALWRGGSLTVVRAMLVTSSQLATYDEVKEGMVRHGMMHDGLMLHVVASVAAGIAASVTSNPVDVIKTRLMNMNVAAASAGPNGPNPEIRAAYTGPVDCAVKTIRLEGPLALYKGLLPTMFRQAPFTIILFVTLERMRKLLRDT